MKRIIFYIFALSMFLSCQEETSSGFRICDGMTFSDALPVQFWLADCETYNEYEAQGVHHICWCAPWLCTDEIITQFQHTTGQSFSLVGKDADGVYLFNSAFSEIQSGVYQASFTPNDEDICDEDIQLLIANTSDLITLIAPSSWTDGGTTFDTKSATQFIDSIPTSGGGAAAEAYQAISGIGDGEFVLIRMTVTVSGTWTTSSLGLVLSMRFTDSSGTLTSVSSVLSGIIEYTANGTYEVVYKVTASSATSARLYIQVNEFLDSGTANITITMPVGDVIYLPDSGIEAKSDCLDIATTQPETILIQYSNQRNFAGLIYENDSPDTTFKIRVPCRFFHETEPEEDEAMELTSSILTTSAQAKTQRLLEVKHVPYYFHKKLRRVLKHQTVTIGSIEWKKEEQYKENEGNKRWPLKSATCLLTEKNSVVRNVL